MSEKQIVLSITTLLILIGIGVSAGFLLVLPILVLLLYCGKGL